MDGPDDSTLKLVQQDSETGICIWVEIYPAAASEPVQVSTGCIEGIFLDDDVLYELVDEECGSYLFGWTTTTTSLMQVSSPAATGSRSVVASARPTSGGKLGHNARGFVMRLPRTAGSSVVVRAISAQGATLRSTVVEQPRASDSRTPPTGKSSTSIGRPDLLGFERCLAARSLRRSQMRARRKTLLVTRWNRRSDAELLAATADAPEAFATFYRRHEQAILAYFLRRTANVEVAADLAAEVFAAALESSSRFRPGPTPARGWLFGIARHVLAMSARRGRVDAEVRRRLQMAPIVLSDEIVDRLESLRRQALAIAEVALLPDDQREAVAAHVMNDDSYAEIADRLGCSEQVVRKRVSRGLAGLRQRLEEELG